MCTEHRTVKPAGLRNVRAAVLVLQDESSLEDSWARSTHPASETGETGWTCDHNGRWSVLWKGKNKRGLLHGGVKFASERIYPNRGPKIFPSMTSLRWTNTTLFFSVFFQNTNIQGAGKEGQGGRRVSLDVLPSEKRTHSSYCQGREVRTSPRGREGRWGIVGIPSKLLILLRGLSGPERDPEF